MRAKTLQNNTLILTCSSSVLITANMASNLELFRWQPSFIIAYRCTSASVTYKGG